MLETPDSEWVSASAISQPFMRDVDTSLVL